MRGVAVDGQTGATVLGDQAGLPVSTNTYIGYQAGQSTVLGTGAVGAGTAGQWNTFVGYQAGQPNVSGDSNTYVGYQAGPVVASGTNGYQNTCVGYQSGGGNNPVQCVSIGYGSSSFSAGGVAVGYSSLARAAGCTAIGSSAIANSGAVTVGSGSGNTSAGQSVIVGSNSGPNVSASNQTFVGYQVGKSNSSGVNTFIGYQAGYSPATLGTTYATTTGTGQTCIGYQTGQAVVSATAPNYITCLGWETTVGASGGVAIGTDHTGAAATTSTQDEIKLGTANHTLNVPGKAKVDAHGTTSGSLSTVTLSSGTGAQVDSTSDRYIAVVISVTLVTDTVAFALSPDNVTYSTLGTLTPGVASSSDLFTLSVPAGWYIKCTVTGSATIAASSVYY